MHVALWGYKMKSKLKNYMKFYEKEGEYTERYKSNEFWERRHHTKRFIRIKRILKTLILKTLTKNNSFSFIDVGCGDGEYLKHIIKYKNKNSAIIGFDISFSYLKRAKIKSQKANFIRGDITNLPVKDNSVDIALCSEVIEHIPDYKKCLKELFRIAKKYIIITTPNHGLRRRIAEKIIGKENVKKKSLKVGHVNIFFIKNLIKDINNIVSDDWELILKETQYNLIPPRNLPIPKYISHILSYILVLIEYIFGKLFPDLGDTIILVYKRR